MYLELYEVKWSTRYNNSAIYEKGTHQNVHADKSVGFQKPFSMPIAEGKGLVVVGRSGDTMVYRWLEIKR